MAHSLGKVCASETQGPEFRSSESTWEPRLERDSVILVLERVAGARWVAGLAKMACSGSARDPIKEGS